MARSIYSPSPSLSPRSPSPSFSESSAEDLQFTDPALDVDASASRPASPLASEIHGLDQLENESVSCLWEECGKPYSLLPTLIEHIHNDHIGVNKSTYTCEWATCPRRGLQQASRFALISHIRAHTGEKPFTCPLPECDKSFTRSDAMAKHMRLQHNISPPLPGRGGNRKRKRGDTTASTTNGASVDGGPSGPGAGAGDGPESASASGHGFTTFKVDGNTPTEGPAGPWGEDDGTGTPLDERADYFSRRPRSASPAASAVSAPVEPDTDGRDDVLPPHLAAALNPSTGTIFGRSPSFAKYIVMKAKHRFVLEQHEDLLEELRVVRAEERRARAAKEAALDHVLQATLGPQAEFLATPIDMSHITRHGVIHGEYRTYEMGNGLDVRPY